MSLAVTKRYTKKVNTKGKWQRKEENNAVWSLGIPEVKTLEYYGSVNSPASFPCWPAAKHSCHY